MSKHIELGREGEDLAVAHLINNGYLIIERNYRFKKLEIDIICEKDNLLIIIEVKTRTTDKLGAPELISRGKQKQVIKATNHFIQERQDFREVRLDVIGIVKNQYEERLIHIEGAFVP